MRIPVSSHNTVRHSTTSGQPSSVHETEGAHISKATHSGLGGTSASLRPWYSFVKGGISQGTTLWPFGKKVLDHC